MSENKTPMTKSDASRIQSHADRTGTNDGFKGRAQSAADKSANQGKGSGGGGKGSGSKGGGGKK